MTTYTNPFTGQTISPSQVGYSQLTISSNTTLTWPINGNSSTNVAANIVEVTATTAGLQVIMPVAQQVSVGQAIIFRNIGSNSFTVVNSSGGTIIAIASGIADYVYLTDNSTVNGTWTTVTFGAGTSSADAASLAGYGLLPINTTLNQEYLTQSYTSDLTLNATNRAGFNIWRGGAGTITLPPSSIGNGWFAMIANDGTGILNIACQGSDTIDGNASAQLQLTESFVIVCNGTGSGFNSFGYGQATQFAFTILSLVVTGGTYTLSASQASNIIQEYTGTLSSNQIIILPPTVQLYSFSNNTTGAYTFTIKTTAIGASTITLASGQTIIVICDGTNVFNSQTAATSTASSLTLGNGSSPNPSLNFTGDTSTGLYLSASGILGFAAAGTAGMTLSTAGLKVTNGIGGGVF